MIITPELLDEIERLANADAEKSKRIVGYVLTGPQRTLALVARIRELEAKAAADLADYEASLETMAAVHAASCTPPAGYKLVPAEPTREMINAAAYLTWTGSVYKAMLAAAPDPTVKNNLTVEEAHK